MTTIDNVSDERLRMFIECALPYRTLEVQISRGDERRLARCIAAVNRDLPEDPMDPTNDGDLATAFAGAALRGMDANDEDDGGVDGSGWRVSNPAPPEPFTLAQENAVRSPGGHDRLEGVVRAPDLTGQTFGRLTVRQRSGSDGAGKALWLCDCDCGGAAVARAGALRSGNTKSCGCAQREAAAAQFRSLAEQNFKSGSTNGEHAAEYRVWSGASQRCSNPNYPGYERYGGRGITMAPEWRCDFLAFLAHVGKRPTLSHSLDRIDNDGHYEPGNVRWATPHEQARNTSTTVRPEIVREVQRALANGEHPKVIAGRFGIHDRTVRAIRDGQHWSLREPQQVAL